ncbi:MAG: M28 family peptidase [Bacteroidota bacterium]
MNSQSCKAFLLFILITFNISYSQSYVPAYGAIVNQCSDANILNNLTQFENFGVKYRNTAAQTNTLNWLKTQYSNYGYTASQIVEDPFSYSGSTCKNLVVTKTGTLYPNTYVIVCGHYDTINGPGTNDNGSGTTLLLEMARLLQNVSTEYSVKFIHFAGEEDGLIGSNHYVDNIVNGTTPKMDIRLVFNIDQVGGVAGMNNNTITCERDLSNPSSNNAQSNTMTNELINCVHLYSTLATNLSVAYSSDYVPFENNGEIITGFYETNESTHPHSSTDLLVNMDSSYLTNVTKAAIGATLHFAKASTTLANADFDTDFQFSFFPNPTKDILKINMGNFTESSYTFKLFNLQGKTVLVKKILQPRQIESINLNGLIKGMYLIEIIAANKRITKKIVVE